MAGRARRPAALAVAAFGLGAVVGWRLWWVQAPAEVFPRTEERRRAAGRAIGEGIVAAIAGYRERAGKPDESVPAGEG